MLEASRRRVWPPAVNQNPPTDRERQIALNIVKAHQQPLSEVARLHSDGIAPQLITSISQALADYRRELKGTP